MNEYYTCQQAFMIYIYFFKKKLFFILKCVMTYMSFKQFCIRISINYTLLLTFYRITKSPKLQAIKILMQNYIQHLKQNLIGSRQTNQKSNCKGTVDSNPSNFIINSYSSKLH